MRRRRPWLETHGFGREEEECHNNHGTWYDRLVVCLALFLGREDRARRQLERTRGRIAGQIEPDGTMPAELRRTCSFGYTLMNTRGFVDFAWIGRRLGVELWSESGGRIGAAVDCLCRHACSAAPWPYPQVEPIEWPMVCPILARAGILSGRPYAFADVSHRMPEGFEPELFPMLEPLHPFGKARSPPCDFRRLRHDPRWSIPPFLRKKGTKKSLAGPDGGV